MQRSAIPKSLGHETLESYTVLQEVVKKLCGLGTSFSGSGRGQASPALEHVPLTRSPYVTKGGIRVSMWEFPKFWGPYYKDY